MGEYIFYRKKLVATRVKREKRCNQILSFYIQMTCIFLGKLRFLECQNGYWQFGMGLAFFDREYFPKNQ